MNAGGTFGLLERRSGRRSSPLINIQPLLRTGESHTRAAFTELDRVGAELSAFFFSLPLPSLYPPLPPLPAHTAPLFTIVSVLNPLFI